MNKRYCGYCLGDVEWSAENNQWQHATDGERVYPNGPGDFITDRHNRAGTKVIAADVIDDSDADRDADRDADGVSEVFAEYSPDLLTDSAGYLDCGCLGSQPEHTCRLAIEADREAAMRAEGGYDI